MASTSVTWGLPKFGWFQILKKSAVNRRFCRSVMWKFLIAEKSQFCWKGPHKFFLCKSPNPVVQKLAFVGSAGFGSLGLHNAGYNSGAVVKAAGFRYPFVIRLLKLPVA